MNILLYITINCVFLAVFTWAVEYLVLQTNYPLAVRLICWGTLVANVIDTIRKARLKRRMAKLGFSYQKGAAHLDNPKNKSE